MIVLNHLRLTEIIRMDVVCEIIGTDNVIVKKECPSCHIATRISVDGSKYNKYISTNRLITDIFPELSVFEREFLMTGYCVDCQEKIFGRKAKKKDKGSFC